MDSQTNPQTPTLPVYPMNMTDHDLLIRLDQKMTQLSLEVNKTNDGLTGRLMVLESKIVEYDQLLAEYPAKKLTEMLYADHQAITEAKFIGRLSFFIGGLIGSILAVLGTILLIATNIIKLGNK